MTPAPISVERLREVVAIVNGPLLSCKANDHAAWEAVSFLQDQGLALLHQLAERDAALEREQGVREDAQRQLRAAERARDGMREQLRIESALLLAWARESREGGWSTHQVDPMKRRAGEIDAFLAASGG